MNGIDRHTAGGPYPIGNGLVGTGRRTAGGARGQRDGLLRETGRRAIGGLTAGLRSMCFWLAVAVPFLTISLLASGVWTPTVQPVLPVLLGQKAVALYLGNQHDPE